MKIPVEISARHVHLSQKDFEKLFGKNKELIPVKKLSQPGEFASDKKITLVNSGREIKNVRILGPLRKNSQAEVSMTDAYSLKLNPLPKIRVSGDLSDTTKITAKTSKASVKIPCIIAKRHLHCSVEESKKLGLKSNQDISVRINSERETTFHDVVVRISENYRLALHLDTDEGNSAAIRGETSGELIK